MDNNIIDIEILETTSDYVKVKLPTFGIPIKMNHQFFQPRVEKGLFRIRNE